MASIVANKAKYALATKQIDFANDLFKIILMDTGFVFDKEAHHGYADVSANELSTGFGYTQNDKILTNVLVVENDTTNLTEITWDNVVFTAIGGDIGPSPGAIIFDDTPTDPQADPLIGYIDFGGESTQVDGGSATIANPKVTI